MHHFSPIRSIWLQPAKTVARISHENPRYRLFTLPVLAGLASWPTMVFFFLEEDVRSVGLFWSSLLTFGPIGEVLQVFVGAWLIQVTGTWFGGKAGRESIQAAIVWGNVPIVLVAVLCIPLAAAALILTGADGADLLYEPPRGVVSFGIALVVLQFMLVGWSFVILVRGLACVQGYGTLRAMVNVAAAWLLPVSLIATLVVVLGHGDSLFPLFFDGFEKLAFVHAV